MDKDPLSSISQADIPEKIGEFWDTHHFTEFDDPNRLDVEFEMRCTELNKEEGKIVDPLWAKLLKYPR